MQNLTFHAEMIVADVLVQWPETALVFNRYKTACPGCVMGPFCSLADVAETYDLPFNQLLADLEQAVQNGAVGNEK